MHNLIFQLFPRFWCFEFVFSFPSFPTNDFNCSKIKMKICQRSFWKSKHLFSGWKRCVGKSQSCKIYFASPYHSRNKSQISPQESIGICRKLILLPLESLCFPGLTFWSPTQPTVNQIFTYELNFPLKKCISINTFILNQFIRNSYVLLKNIFCPFPDNLSFRSR